MCDHKNHSYISNPSTSFLLLFWFFITRSASSPLPPFITSRTHSYTLCLSLLLTSTETDRLFPIHLVPSCLALSFSRPPFLSPPSSLSLSRSLSTLISVGSPGINRQFQSSAARFTLFCGQWPAYRTHTHTHTHERRRTLTQQSHCRLVRGQEVDITVRRRCPCHTSFWH